MPISEHQSSRGFTLGRQGTTTFMGVSQAAAETSRDDFFTVNPGLLTAYDNDSTQVIRLTYPEGDLTVTRFQGRLIGGWVDITPVVQGPSGEVASLVGVPVGEIPYKTITGDFAGSNMRILDDGSILAPAGFKVESGSITFGEALTLSEVSGFLGITNHLNDRLYTVVDFYTPRETGSTEPSIFFLTAGQSEFVAQATDTTNIPDNPLIYNYTVQNTARSHALKFSTYAAMTNVRMKISLVSNGVALKYLPSRQAWEEELGGVDWLLGDNSVSFGDTPLNLNAGTELKFELRADVVAVKGNALGIPYFTAMIQQGVFVDVITDNVYKASDIKAKLETLSSPNKLAKTAIQDAVLSVNSAYGNVVLGKADIGLSNADNTSDINKPVSTAQQTAIDNKMSAHLAAGDPHPEYTTTAEASAAAPVQTVQGLTGAVSLTTANIPESGSLYYSDSRVTNYLSSNGYTVKSASSIGAGSAVYKQNNLGNVEFRSVIGSGLLTVTQNANDITLTVPTLLSGTYTPTITNISNIQAVTAFVCMYTRVGSMVTVNGRVNIDTTTNGSATAIEMTLPIASNLGAVGDLMGVSGCAATIQAGAVYANISTDRAVMEFQAGSNAARDHSFTYMYRVI